MHAARCFARQRAFQLYHSSFALSRTFFVFSEISFRTGRFFVFDFRSELWYLITAQLVCQALFSAVRNFLSELSESSLWRFRRNFDSLSQLVRFVNYFFQPFRTLPIPRLVPALLNRCSNNISKPHPFVNAFFAFSQKVDLHSYSNRGLSCI